MVEWVVWNVVEGVIFFKLASGVIERYVVFKHLGFKIPSGLTNLGSHQILGVPFQLYFFFSK